LDIAQHLRILLTHPTDALAHYFGEAPLAALRGMGRVCLNPGSNTWTEAELVERVMGHDVVVLDRATPAGAAVFDADARLAAVCRVAVDIRNIDVVAASARGVLVTQASAGFQDAVAEWIVGAMIDLSRHISNAVVEYRNGIEPVVRRGRQIGSSTVGIVGYGQIAQRLHRLLLAFGCRVLVHDPYVSANGHDVELRSFEGLLQDSDFVVCLAAATDETENMFSAAAFSAMRREAFFINASRGNLVNEEALAEALEAKLIAGAAIDVGRASDQRPNLIIAQRPDVVATPHIGGNTPESVLHQAWCVVEQVRALSQGEVPSGAVNPQDWTRRLRLCSIL
jgi:D-3-phosphoglycerate dehydrogenase / 2-oxoglutarate reductase